MYKAMKHSQVAAELKKEYLREHLESIKTLIRNWIAGLHPPEPLAPNDRVWGWQSLYRPPIENNPDELHMLRHHLKSRALWSHYSNWQKKMEEIFQLIERVRLKAKARQKKLSMNRSRKYTEDYVPVALWKAFDMALGKAIDLPFKLPDDKFGLSYGGYKIEELANNAEGRISIEEEYRSFISSISQSSTMRCLANSWLEASQLEVQISTISNNIMKSGNIFYMCRFCRYLWR
jgi:hypothetical protein